MKTIAQLLQLSKNRFYKFTPEEQKLLDDFLATQSGQSSQQKDSSIDLSKKTPATVHKNIVQKDTGVIPTDEPSDNNPLPKPKPQQPEQYRLSS